MEAPCSETLRVSKEDGPVIDVDEENLKEPVDDDQTVEQDKNVGGRLRSYVWKHFTKDLKTGRATCGFCKHVVVADSVRNGTSIMNNHLRRYCKLSPYRIKVDPKQTKLVNKPSNSQQDGGTLVPHKFNQEKCRILFAQVCIKDNRPFSISDDVGLREWAWELNPSFRFPSRYTVARDCNKIYEEEKKKLKVYFKDRMVSLTTDTWTSIQNLNYMCLTAQWIDDDWVLRKKIINFRQISDHRVVTIGKLAYRCLEEWSIERVFTVTVDNASPNDGAINYLKIFLKGPHSVLDCKYLLLRCNAHIINLVVRDGLQEQFDSISRIRNAVRYVRSSPSRFKSFRDCVEKVGIKCQKKPGLDVETRWNSTFLMLETSLEFEKAFLRLEDVESSYRSYFFGDVVDKDSTRITKKRKKSAKVEGAPDTDDFQKARIFVEFLRLFFNVTKKISGSKYTTANLVFHEVSKICKSIRIMCAGLEEKKKNMGESMKSKFEKYWDNLDNMNLLLHVALVLDPRNKIDYLGYSLTLRYGKGSEKIGEFKTLVKQTLKELFEHYKSKIDKEKEPKSTTSIATNLFDDGESDDDNDGFDKYLDEEGAPKIVGNELEIYLSDGTENRKDDTFDVLGWWKINSMKFPILSQISKHVLAMPISTVASESAFSTGGRVIDKIRSSLTPTTAEALICAQDWLNFTPSDLEDHLDENSETFEDDLKSKKACKDSSVGDDED